jgi:hypothetical protein
MTPWAFSLSAIGVRRARQALSREASASKPSIMYRCSRRSANIAALVGRLADCRSSARRRPCPTPRRRRTRPRAPGGPGGCWSRQNRRRRSARRPVWCAGWVGPNGRVLPLGRLAVLALDTGARHGDLGFSERARQRARAMTVSGADAGRGVSDTSGRLPPSIAGARQSCVQLLLHDRLDDATHSLANLMFRSSCVAQLFVTAATRCEAGSRSIAPSTCRASSRYSGGVNHSLSRRESGVVRAPPFCAIGDFL